MLVFPLVVGAGALCLVCVSAAYCRGPETCRLSEEKHQGFSVQELTGSVIFKNLCYKGVLKHLQGAVWFFKEQLVFLSQQRKKKNKF